jgi:DNA polymerase-3 subunit delta
MTPVRVVIVLNLLTRLAPRGKRGQEAEPDADPAWKREFLDKLKDYLTGLPPTTRLIFVESQVLPESHAILKLAQSEEKEKRAHLRAFHLPKEAALSGWIQRHARDLGGWVSPDAADLLAALVGRDLRLLDLEIDKLLLYVNGERPVQAADVRRLVSRAREESVFDLVDCIGRRQTDQALRLVHHMLEDEAEPLQILGMIGRQVRILIEVSELRAQGLAPPEIAARLKLHPFPVSKALDQVKNFQMAQLEAAHERVVETDWAIKTGRLEDRLALDLLVVNLGSGP